MFSLSLLLLIKILSSVVTTRAVIVNATTFSKDAFDFIVVGAGTAGTALAVRLSDNASLRVGLIEGGNYHKNDPMVLVPNLHMQAYGEPEYDWRFATTPQKALNNRSLPMVRGKGVGGCSQVNDLGFLRAGSVEYDLIGELGNPGWSWNSSLHYFKKVENVTVGTPKQQREQNALADISIRGTRGPIRTSFSSVFSQAVPLFFSVLKQLGVRLDVGLGDGLDGNYAGNPLCSIDPDTNTRSYAATGYFEPNAHRKNLVLITGAQVTRVLFSDTRDAHGNLRAEGVEYVDLSTSHKYTARATREVVLSAGSAQSPQLLELSGIGNPKLLAQHGIETRIDNPNVGENYQDHVIIFEAFEVDRSIDTWDFLADPVQNASAYNEFLQNHTGVYAACITALSYISADHLADAQTIAQWMVELDREFNATHPSKGARIIHETQKKRLLPGSQETTFEVYLAPVNPFPDTVVPGKHYIQLAAIPQHPFSRGWIHIQSSDPLAPPEIELNAFGLSIDRRISIAAAKFVRKVSEMLPLRPVIRADVLPIKSTSSDAQWLEHIRETIDRPFHPCCTAAMLPHELGGVVSPQLVVYGTSNLRVADLSTLPFILGTHPMATAYTIGERAADLIKAAHPIH